MIQLGIYKHYKGNLYNVIGTAKHSETQIMHVIYHPIDQPTNVWIRPLDMFVEHILLNQQTIARFAKV
jgi:hypothetical protein